MSTPPPGGAPRPIDPLQLPPDHRPPTPEGHILTRFVAPEDVRIVAGMLAAGAAVPGLTRMPLSPEDSHGGMPIERRLSESLATRVEAARSGGEFEPIIIKPEIVAGRGLINAFWRRRAEKLSKRAGYASVVLHSAHTIEVGGGYTGNQSPSNPLRPATMLERYATGRLHKIRNKRHENRGAIRRFETTYEPDRLPRSTTPPRTGERLSRSERRHVGFNRGRLALMRAKQTRLTKRYEKIATGRNVVGRVARARAVRAKHLLRKNRLIEGS